LFLAIAAVAAMPVLLFIGRTRQSEGEQLTELLIE
jgi:hypothetical protein